MTGSFFSNIVNEGILLACVIAAEITIRYIRSRRKTVYIDAKRQVTNASELETLTLEYIKNDQQIGVIRLALYVGAVLISVLIYDIQAFSFLVLGVGALLVILRESVMSLIAYFYILAAYHVGEDIRIGDTLGEINKISPLYTAIVGKEETGEFNGKLVTVPNFFFFQQKVERQELKSTNYRRTTIQWTYNRDHVRVPFPDLVISLRTFLDELLPVRQVDEIGHFRNYAGRRYRLSLDYNADGFPTIKLTFVARPDEIGPLREKIIRFLEGTHASK